MLTLEKHGNGFTLYSGRDQDHHGYNLCSINDFDMNGAITIGRLRSAITALEELSKLRSEVADGLSHISPDRIVKMYDKVLESFRNTGDY